MRSRLPTVLGLALALAATGACSSNDTAPPTPTAQRAPVVRDYGPEVGSGTYGAPDGFPSASAAPSAGPIRWHSQLANAQAEARASGRLSLVLATKPSCSLCDKFKTTIAPATSGELSRVAVGYVYDITRPEVRDVDRILRANLRGADLMPLVGFLTADLGWVHGFWGQRSVTQFRGDIAQAAGMSGMRAQLAAPAHVDAPRTAMVVNEFGEREWALVADVWPEGDPAPIDAITGEPGPGRAAVMADTSRAPVLADATPTTTAPAPPQAAPAAAGGRGLPALVPDAPAPARIEAPSPQPPVAVAPPRAAAGTEPETPAARDESWGRRSLEQARELIAEGRFTEARTLIDDVGQTLPESTLAREAAKGAIALYNAKRIQLATSGSERTEYLTRARRDLGRSMWGDLFGS